MSLWAVQDAKARFSEFLNSAVKKGPQVVTRRGVETAVLVPIDEWKRLKSSAPPTLKDWLLAPEPRIELDLTRRKYKLRKPVRFE